MNMQQFNRLAADAGFIEPEGEERRGKQRGGGTVQMRIRGGKGMGMGKRCVKMEDGRGGCKITFEFESAFDCLPRRSNRSFVNDSCGGGLHPLQAHWVPQVGG